jgi:hypothetical protein
MSTEVLSTENKDKEYKESKSGVHSGPIGLDIGTANIVKAQEINNELKTEIEVNAFFTIPYSNITKKALIKDNTLFIEKNKQFYIMGNAAENFAAMLSGDTRKPIEKGILNAKEDDGIDVIKAIISKVIGKSHDRNTKICFTVPGKPVDSPVSVVFHESVLKKHLEGLGYSAISINEGLAVVLSELEGNKYTGIGISLGGGMCNVCFSYLSVPVVTYSIQKGGDYIDTMVGNSVGEHPTKIKLLKEEDLNLSAEPKNRIETGLHIYYDDLFASLAGSLHQVLGSSDNIPRISNLIPIVLSGGTVLPRGSKEKFAKALKEVRLPLKISDIIIPDKPLYTAAKGALIMALSETA